MASTPQPPKKGAAPSPWLYLLGGVILGVLATLAVVQGLGALKAHNAKPEVWLANNRSSDKAILETGSGLQYKVLAAGKGGAKPTDTDIALVNYEGKLVDGTTFDKSQQPTPMPVTGVVPGFSEALKLMPKGAKYRFWIKPSLGYGDKASGPIPANSVLVFDVELIDFLPEAVVRQLQAKQMQAAQAGAAQAGAAPAGQPKP